jgi:hypothetical protein
MPKTILLSNRLKCCPRQLRGPAINGKNVKGAGGYSGRKIDMGHTTLDWANTLDYDARLEC